MFTPTERDKLLLSVAAMVARDRKNRGLKLNYPESVALISSQILEWARDGKSVAELMDDGATVLTTDDVMDGIADMIESVQVEATFRDGTKLVTVHHPIRQSFKNLEKQSLQHQTAPGAKESALDAANPRDINALPPGSLVIDGAALEGLTGRKTTELTVKNTGDRPIQVGSHFHFFEVNGAMNFKRADAWGMRLAIPAGTAIRFEPGLEYKVPLIELGGERVVYGMNGLVNGPLDKVGFKDAALAAAKKQGFKGA